MKKTDQWNEGGKHEISGDGSCKIEAYQMAPTDVCHERRNFPGYESNTPSEDLMNEVSCEGTTRTREDEYKSKGTPGGRRMNYSHTYAAGEMKRRFS